MRWAMPSSFTAAVALCAIAFGAVLAAASAAVRGLGAEEIPRQASAQPSKAASASASMNGLMSTRHVAGHDAARPEARR
jgi:hypothetical protein